MSLAEVAIAAALAWGAGLRAYAVIFAVGAAGALGWIELPGHLEVLQHPIVLAASAFMTCVEFFADKLPWLDSIWDAVHSFVRIPAGAALAALAFGDSGTAITVAAAIFGGTLTAAVHATKAGTRAAINASPEPFSNWGASLSEDALVPLGLWLAVAHPILFFVLLAVFLVAAALLLRFLWRAIASTLLSSRWRRSAP
jgi:phosphoribosylcarboxyaminoimidazole (NCAIR) mutase